MTRSLTLPSAWRAGARAAGRARIADKLPLLSLIVLLTAFLALGARLIDVGAGDLGIAGLFSTDEKLAGQLVGAMIRNGNLGLSHFFSYGPLDLYLARALLWPYGLFRPISDEAILIALRVAALASGAASICVTYALGRRLWNAWTGAAGAAILVASTALLAWSTTAHPDMLQLFWLLLGLWAATGLSTRTSRGWLVAGSVCAALAFATKYTGELLLPVLWLADAVGRFRSGGADEPLRLGPLLRRLLVDIALSGVVFAAGFLILDPGAVREWRGFVYQIGLEAGLAHRGHLLQATGDLLGWLRLLAGSDVLGPAGAACALIGLVAWTGADLRSVLRHPASAEGARRLPLELFTAGYLLLLLIWIGDRQARYALPALPGLALMAGAAIVWITGRRRPVGAIGLALLLLTLAPLSGQLLAYERVQAGRMRGPGIAERIEAGRWLAAHIAPETPVLADAYTYLPPNLTNVDESFGVTHAQIFADRPHVIVTDTSIRDRFLDPARSAKYLDGAAAYQEIAATYQELESGRLPCYPLLQRFGPVAIYGQPSGGPCPASP